jgi:hypothetical protein
MAANDPNEAVTRWLNAGDDAFYCIADGAIVAVLYWQPVTAAEVGGGWSLIHADDPDNRVALGIGGRHDEEAALDAADRRIIERKRGQD